MYKLHHLFLSVLLLITGISSTQGQFIQRSGNILRLGTGGSEIQLRGIAFGNWVWVDDTIPSTHHGEKDFERVKAMGFNAVRFYFNYKTFENDNSPYSYKQSGWDWLDSNILWAKRNNIYLILNMHVPQGGFQSQCNGAALWNTPDHQNRAIALWRAIADRYKNEVQIAGYDLLNEPMPVSSTDQWKALAENMIAAIREVDFNHLIIAENAIALNCDYGYNDGTDNFFSLAEQNLMYTLHFYEPYEYTHQLQSWAGTGDGGKYPNPAIISPPADIQWVIGQYNNPKLPSGTSDWAFYQGLPFLVSSDTTIIARPVLYAYNVGAGKAYFDYILLDEVTSSGGFIRSIYTVNFTKDESFRLWSQNNTGTKSFENTGFGDNGSYSVSGTTAQASVTIPSYQFKVEKNKYYRICGYMKGENIPSNASCQFALELYHSPSRQPVYYRNKEFLRQSILRQSQYPRHNGYPVYYGEFGAGHPCFNDNKGGDIWVEDMMDILDSLGYHYTYHSYHEGNFGVYDGWQTPIDTTMVNEVLVNTFKSHMLSITPIYSPTIVAPAEFRVSPNPFDNSLKIENSTKLTYDIRIHDIEGKIVYAIQNGEPLLTIDTGQWQQGTYILTAKVSDENSLYFKLVKNK